MADMLPCLALVTSPSMKKYFDKFWHIFGTLNSYILTISSVLVIKEMKEFAYSVQGSRRNPSMRSFFQTGIPGFFIVRGSTGALSLRREGEIAW
jgi:hypothetical protein